MRTATTIGKLRDGGAWVMLSGPDVPLTDQFQYFRMAAGVPSDEYEVLRYQEDDGVALVHLLKSKAETDAHATRNAEQNRIAAENSRGKARPVAAKPTPAAPIAPTPAPTIPETDSDAQKRAQRLTAKPK